MSDFTSNVFINCPFDDEFRPLLQSLLYTIKVCGFQPRIALERFDSGEVRLEKIKQLLEASMFGIHDLNRIKAEKKGVYFRLNMPLELGIDLGCRYYHPEAKYRNKKFLILENEKWSVQKGLSDLSFADCKSHGGSVREIIQAVRDWFVELGYENIQPASSILDGFNFFLTNKYKELQQKGYQESDIQKAPIKEYMNWIDEKFAA